MKYHDVELQGETFTEHVIKQQKSFFQGQGNWPQICDFPASASPLAGITGILDCM